MINYSAQHVFHVSFLCVSFQSFNFVVEDVVKISILTKALSAEQSSFFFFFLCLEACS